MSLSRKELVRLAYNKIKSGAVATLDDLAKNYDPEQHPDVLNGSEASEAHYLHFMSSWDAKKPTDQVTLAEFEKFYQAVAALLPNEEEFTYLLRAEWHI